MTVATKRHMHMQGKELQQFHPAGTKAAKTHMDRQIQAWLAHDARTCFVTFWSTLPGPQIRHSFRKLSRRTRGFTHMHTHRDVLSRTLTCIHNKAPPCS